MQVTLITVVIPCLNEELNIEEFYRRVNILTTLMMPKKIELIFINDGSTDNTGLILDKIADNDKKVKVLHFAQNRGHQIALTAGMDHAVGDVIVTIDADLQHPPELICEMIEKVECGYDIVHAKRRSRSGETLFKRSSARVFYFFMQYFSGVRLIEDSAEFRAFTRPVLEAVKSFRMPHRFLRGIFSQLGFKQCVITFDSQDRYAGGTKYSFIKMVNLALDGALAYSAAPIRFITWLSVILWSVSLIHLIKSLIEHFVLKITVPGWTSIIFLMFFFTGLILFSIAIIGSYVGRIFVQGQKIPLYWLSDARNLDYEQLPDGTVELPEVELSRRIIQAREKNC